jgi:hypothetical protein
MDFSLDILSAYISDEDNNYLHANSVITGNVDRKKVEEFFGGNIPFSGQVVKLRDEDNKWLSGSWIGSHVARLLEIIGSIKKQLEHASKCRKAKADLFAKREVYDGRRVETREFGARGEPQVIRDPRTGEEKLRPRSRNISRNVVVDR